TVEPSRKPAWLLASARTAHSHGALDSACDETRRVTKLKRENDSAAARARFRAGVVPGVGTVPGVIPGWGRAASAGAGGALAPAAGTVARAGDRSWGARWSAATFGGSS